MPCAMAPLGFELQSRDRRNHVAQRSTALKTSSQDSGDGIRLKREIQGTFPWMLEQSIGLDRSWFLVQIPQINGKPKNEKIRAKDPY